MLNRLVWRLITAFTVVIGLSLVVAGLGSFLLLRDQEEDAARERVGRLAEPIAAQVALMDLSGSTPQEIQTYLDGYANRFGVRIVLLDGQWRVVGDSHESLLGLDLSVVNDPSLEVVQVGSARFRTLKYGTEEGNLLLFVSPETGLGSTADRILAASEYRPVIAVAEERITSTWLAVTGRLAPAVAVALVASLVVSAVLSRSISGRLVRITRASEEMARGKYDQEIQVYGRDEVGRLAEAFNHMAREVSRSHQAMRDLLANVSHELKTPLTSIEGFSQAMVEAEVRSPEELADSARIINGEAQRMRALIDDLLYLSRMESGQLDMQWQQVDLEDLLRACVERFQWQLEQSDVTMQLELKPVHALRGDERRLEQAFCNLIDNAVRHTPAGGTITVRGEVVNGAAHVTVHNTGSFIPPEALPRVFERFFQVDRSRRREGGHSGLGLSIAAEVVQAHHGTVEANSSRETGTEFTVRLPLAVAGERRGGYRTSAG